MCYHLIPTMGKMSESSESEAWGSWQADGRKSKGSSYTCRSRSTWYSSSLEESRNGKRSIHRQEVDPVQEVRDGHTRRQSPESGRKKRTLVPAGAQNTQKRFRSCAKPTCAPHLLASVVFPEHGFVGGVWTGSSIPSRPLIEYPTSMSWSQRALLCEDHPHCTSQERKKWEKRYGGEQAKLNEYWFLCACQANCLACIRAWAEVHAVDINCRSCNMDAIAWASQKQPADAEVVRYLIHFML